MGELNVLTTAFSPYQDLPYANKLRQPRALVTINDIPVVWEEIQVMTTTFFTADNYSLSMPLSGQNEILNLEYWASVSDINIKIYIGFPINPNAFNSGELDLFIVGSVDIMEIDLANANIRFSGRDLTSRLIDTKTTQVYANETASNIATKLAIKHSLKPIVTPTSEKVGRFFNNITTNAQSLLTREITEWDLLVYLAQQSGYVVYVQSESLIFKPFPTEVDASYVLNYQPRTLTNASPTFYGTDISFKRSLTLASDVVVKIIVPINPQTRKSFIKTASYSRRNRGLKNVPPPSGRKQVFTQIMAGLTPEQAQQQANALAKSISLQEIVMTAKIPGDNLLRKDSLIRIQGTQAAFDQIYYTDTVTRKITIDGYDMDIVAKNHSTDSKLQL